MQPLHLRHRKISQRKFEATPYLLKVINSGFKTKNRGLQSNQNVSTSLQFAVGFRVQTFYFKEKVTISSQLKETITGLTKQLKNVTTSLQESLETKVLVMNSTNFLATLTKFSVPDTHSNILPKEKDVCDNYQRVLSLRLAVRGS